MLAFPNAKINLGLNVTGSRPDGYHTIETVLIPIGFSDILEIVPSSGQEAEFDASGLEIPGRKEENLCLAAYDLLTSEYGISGIRMHLHKVIPSGAGLGGGSSDAAFAIRMLNDVFSLAMTDDRMRELAGRLGSDCAFFVGNQPVFASGRGDLFEPVEIHLPGFTVVLVIPPVHVSTAEAYKLVENKKPAERIPDILKAHPAEWRHRLVNDFEGPVMQRYPVIAQVRDGLFADRVPAPGIFKGMTVWKGKMA
jgi:4-diphosphocytidyl-2-C-methyl-D-erythritol kinase